MSITVLAYRVDVSGDRVPRRPRTENVQPGMSHVANGATGNILPGGGATHRWYQCKDFGLSPSQEIGRGISHHCRPQGFLRSVFQGCGYKPPFAATAK